MTKHYLAMRGEQKSSFKPLWGWVFFSFLAVLASNASEGAPRLDCPCTVEFQSQTSVLITTGLVNSSASATGTIRLSLQVSDDIAFGSFFELTAHPLSPLAGGASVPAFSVSAPIEFVSARQRFYYRLAVSENNGGVWQTVDAIRMESPLATGYEFGEVYLVDPEGPDAFLPTNPTFALQPDGRTFSLSIPEIRNDSRSAGLGALTLELYESPSPVLYGSDYYVQFSQPLGQILGAGQSIRNLTIDSRLDYDLDPQIYLHLAVLDGNGELQFWQTIYSNTAQGFVPRDSELIGVDYLTDTDTDGISDYAEKITSTNPLDPSDAPSKSVTRVLLLQPSSLRDYPGYEARLEHIKSYSNEVLAQSGVDMEIEFAGPIDISVSRTVDALNNSSLLDQLTSRASSFTNLDALRDQNAADLVIYLDRSKTQDTSCGVAWLSGLNMHGDVAPDLMEATYNIGVVDIDSEFCSTRTLIHEIGHLLGLGHSRRQASEGTFAWSLGHGVDDEFATIMAYETSFGSAVERDYFSSPSNMNCSGQACGVDSSNLVSGADAARSLNAVRQQVANVHEGFSPSIRLVGSPEVSVPLNGIYAEPGAQAFDWEDGDLSQSVIVNGVVDTSRAGSYELQYLVRDSDQRLAQTTRIVRVESDSIAVDSDGDGVSDTVDRFPLIDLDGRADFDLDGAPDTCDLACLVTGMQADIDDDNDGIADTVEREQGTDPYDPLSFKLPSKGLTGRIYHWARHTLMSDFSLSLPGKADVVTDVGGDYQFNLSASGFYSVSAVRTVAPSDLNKTITSADALAALKIAVGLNPNTDPDGAGPAEAMAISPYQLMAADINQDGRVTSSDALGILKLAVGLSSAPSAFWVAVPDTERLWLTHSDRTNTFVPASSVAIAYPATSTLNFVSVLVGDVNGSWNPPTNALSLDDEFFREAVLATDAPLSIWGIADQDGDGVSDSLELVLGTRIDAADSDGDGVSDLVDSAPLNSSVYQSKLISGEKLLSGFSLDINGSATELASEGPDAFELEKSEGLKKAGSYIQPIPTFESLPPLFLRGDMNDWDVDLPFERVSENRRQVVVKLDAGTYGFKVAMADWSVLSLGPSFASQASLEDEQVVQLSPNPDLLTVTVQQSGTYVFELNFTGATLGISLTRAMDQ